MFLFCTDIFKPFLNKLLVYVYIYVINYMLIIEQIKILSKYIINYTLFIYKSKYFHFIIYMLII